MCAASIADPEGYGVDMPFVVSWRVDPIEQALVADLENAHDLGRGVEGLSLDAEVFEARGPHRGPRHPGPSDGQMGLSHYGD